MEASDRESTGPGGGVTLTVQSPTSESRCLDEYRSIYVEPSSEKRPRLQLSLVDSDKGITGPNAIRDEETLVVESSIDDPELFRVKIGGRPYVLKLRYDSEDRIPTLRREASWYRNELKHLQGIAVPRFYGQFEGNDTDGEQVCCIVLEDCGNKRTTVPILYQKDKSVRCVEPSY